MLSAFPHKGVCRIAAWHSATCYPGFFVSSMRFPVIALSIRLPSLKPPNEVRNLDSQHFANCLEFEQI